MNAYLLAGGFSRRMGFDKTLISFNGFPLILYLYRKVSKFFPTFVITKPKKIEIYKRLGIENVIPDSFEDFQTPLVGIYTALNHSGEEFNLILSADLPLLCNQILEFFKNYYPEKGFLGFVPFLGGKYHFNCSLYSKGLIPYIEKSLKRGDLSIKQFLPLFKILEESLLKDFGIFEKCCFNLNTREDLRKLNLQHF